MTGDSAVRKTVLTTERLMLVAPDMDDCDALCRLWSDPETMRYIGAGGTWSREQVVERIERAIGMQRDRGMTFWTVVEKDSDEVIGQGGLVPIEFNGSEIELGYRLGRAHWGKGYATEIARAAAAYGFDTLDLDALVAVCYAENLPSRRVLIKAGFHEAGESDLYYGVKTIVHRMNASDGVR